MNSTAGARPAANQTPIFCDEAWSMWQHVPGDPAPPLTRACMSQRGFFVILAPDVSLNDELVAWIECGAGTLVSAVSCNVMI